MTKDKWISIKDKMPNSGECILIYSKNSGVAEGSWESKNNFFVQYRWSTVIKNVTHWMPLPNPPINK